MTYIKILFFTLIVLLSCSIYGTAQNQLQVATKEVRQTFMYGMGTDLSIMAEKAEIEVTAWAKDQIKVTLVISAQHPDKEIAGDNLKYMKYEFAQEGKSIQLRSFIQRDEGKLPEAHITAKFKIQMPQDCPLLIRNTYGKVLVDNMNRESDIQGTFCNIELSSLSGMTVINSRYGELVGNSLSGKVRINARHTEMTLQDMRGSYDIQATYCVLSLFAHELLEELFVNASQSDVELHHPDLGAARYTIAVANGQIFEPEELELRYLDKTKNYKRARHATTREVTGSNIRLSVSYGDVRLR